MEYLQVNRPLKNSIVSHCRDPKLFDWFLEQNLVAILYDLFWAGSDTTSSTISYGILWLTIHESVQAKLRQELLDFISKHGKLPAFNDKNR